MKKWEICRSAKRHFRYLFFISSSLIYIGHEKKLVKQDKVNTADSSFIFFDNLKSKSMVRLVRAEKMVLSGLVFARKIARMILIHNI